MIMNDKLIYSERLTSKWTELLFVILMILFLGLFIWRTRAAGFGALAGLFLFLTCFFLFYVLNFRVLNIQLTAASLKLTFGVISWTVPLENVQDCRLDDDIPLFMRLGGAGVHFMMVRKRYRASFNFLEYPRVVVAFKRKVGWVRDISFSTRRPQEVVGYVQNARRA
jgi:hypothetical protein